MFLEIFLIFILIDLHCAHLTRRGLCVRQSGNIMNGHPFLENYQTRVIYKKLLLEFTRGWLKYLCSKDRNWGKKREGRMFSIHSRNTFENKFSNRPIDKFCNLSSSTSGLFINAHYRGEHRSWHKTVASRYKGSTIVKAPNGDGVYAGSRIIEREIWKFSLLPYASVSVGWARNGISNLA